jgi:hypothetical protein
VQLSRDIQRFTVPVDFEVCVQACECTPFVRLGESVRLRPFEVIHNDVAHVQSEEDVLHHDAVIDRPLQVDLVNPKYLG